MDPPRLELARHQVLGVSRQAPLLMLALQVELDHRGKVVVWQVLVEPDAGAEDDVSDAATRGGGGDVAG